MSCQENDAGVLDALAHANDQFHWGTKPEELEDAADQLIGAGANAALAQELGAKARRMRAIERLLPTPRLKRQPRSRSCCARLPATSPAAQRPLSPALTRESRPGFIEAQK